MSALIKTRDREEIQIGYKTFSPMLIKWKYKRRIHFEIETMKKILAHLIRLNSSQFNERFKRFTI
jgi:hypothetical protein